MSANKVDLVTMTSAAIAASLLTYLLTRNKNATSKEESNNEESYALHQTLGPERTVETQFELNLRGKVDKIYEHFGPKPFEFDSEVVSVFDDMVSRSVPLYCEVIDLAIYYFERYYKTGTKVYDLGCSTGTTLDILARAAESILDKYDGVCEFVGIDNSEAMIKACQEKMSWASEHSRVDIRCGDILETDIVNASFVIMNYTLQFVPVMNREDIVEKIFNGMNEGGIFLLSEKIRAECSEIQETCTWIYEDFKERRKYTKREIARKKEALMNVLVPFTERELRNVLSSAGFDSVEVIAKWNNFVTFVARKHSTPAKRKQKSRAVTPHLDALFDAYPVYLSDYLEGKILSEVCFERQQYYREKGGFGMSVDNLKKFDNIARLIQELPKLKSKTLIVDQPELIIGDPDELTEDQMKIFNECINSLKPWKKGPLKLFGTKIDSEWRSDFKWERLQKAIVDIDLDGKTICDLGCGNGYFMYRMLEYNPKLVVGIDPNLHAWLEFNLFQRISGVDNLKFEYLRGDVMSSMAGMFDVVFCLGVLYHTPDPIGMLHDIKKSMRAKSTLIVDCQGIDGEDHIALFPKKRYTNMKGVYFLPTLNTLKNWLQRANFNNIKVIFGEELSTEEQRATDWANVRSLRESLDPKDDSKTVEGYPRAHRFYVQCTK